MRMERKGGGEIHPGWGVKFIVNDQLRANARSKKGREILDHKANYNEVHRLCQEIIEEVPLHSTVHVRVKDENNVEVKKKITLLAKNPFYVQYQVNEEEPLYTDVRKFCQMANLLQRTKKGFEKNTMLIELLCEI